MVKVRDFCGAVFKPEDYAQFLLNNLEHLEEIPMSKKFNSKKSLEDGVLHLETEQYFYIYRQINNNHISFGIIAEISLQDYEKGKIKKHEQTLIRPGLNHQTYAQQHVGPIVVSHRENKTIRNTIIQLVSTHTHYADWLTIDKRHHTIWKITQTSANILKFYQQIDSLYILDGHHRLKAAHQNRKQKKDNLSEKDEWIQAIIYSSEDIVMHPQHRGIKSVPREFDLIEHLQNNSELQVHAIECINEADELSIYDIVLRLFGVNYGINMNQKRVEILDKVPAHRLQKIIINELKQMGYVKGLKYIPGIINPTYINEYDLIFFVNGPSIDTLFQIADNCEIMPPKSTWIQPKPCSHMVIRLPN